jgi:hypothetical protein
MCIIKNKLFFFKVYFQIDFKGEKRKSLILCCLGQYTNVGLKLGTHESMVHTLDTQLCKWSNETLMIMKTWTKRNLWSAFPIMSCIGEFTTLTSISLTSQVIIFIIMKSQCNRVLFKGFVPLWVDIVQT